MKRLLPHFLYLSLITGLGIFFRLRLQSDNQLIALLNRSTDEAQTTAGFVNRIIQKEMSRQARKYPSPRNSAFEQRVKLADSLVLASFTNPVGRDSLSSALWTLTDSNPRTSQVFQTLLPAKKQGGFSKILAQNDSLRRQWAFTELLYYCADQTGGIDLRFDAVLPAISHTVICPTPGKPFETAIVLSHFSTPCLTSLSVNGRTLPHKCDLAHFVQTFPRPGVYPLHVKAETQLWGSDSLWYTEKTFYLHVNQ